MDNFFAFLWALSVLVAIVFCIAFVLGVIGMVVTLPFLWF